MLHQRYAGIPRIALTGRWEVFWGPEGERRIVLEPWDTISFYVSLGGKDLYTTPIIYIFFDRIATRFSGKPHATAADPNSGAAGA